MKQHAGTGAVYGLGFLGALVYFLQHSHGLGEFVLGFVKALVWPGIFVYKIFEFLRL